MSLKPITLWSHKSGPNPWKVAIILEELGLPYETKFIDFPDMKKPDYESINPNGRVPSIQDPNNNGLTLFESGAIIEYLVETYDKENKIQYDTGAEKWLARAWLHFQVSGQGPYFGQKAWFTMFHSEKIPSALDRYANEIRRVLGVIDSHLKSKGTPFLVGDKCTYADLSFVPWAGMTEGIMSDTDLNIAKDYPTYNAWYQRMVERPAVKKTLDAKKAA